ncbi:hypothetical protein [Thaumasiovibrio sp. DFM-14]|uniref:hypothetical protein n=1 Tax=Thaumasiovibrio sp. DFM-14 TaxID=3384792 RepID=UPI00399EF641
MDRLVLLDDGDIGIVDDFITDMPDRDMLAEEKTSAICFDSAGNKVIKQGRIIDILS